MERETQINNLINTIANNTQGVTEEQVKRAREMYKNDKRDLSEIEKELQVFSQQIASESRKKVEKDLKENKHQLNDMFDCRMTGNTLHLHITPPSLRNEIEEMGPRKLLDRANDELKDAMDKLPKVLKEHPEIDIVFAVSPLLSMKQTKEIFANQGFSVSRTTDQRFLDMFPGKKVGQAIISKEKLIRQIARNRSLAPEEKEYERISQSYSLSRTEKIDALESLENRVLKKQNHELASMIEQQPSKQNNQQSEKGMQYVYKNPHGFAGAKTLILMGLIYLGLIASYVLFIKAH